MSADEEALPQRAGPPIALNWTGACVMDILVPLLIGLLWGLALAGLLKVWTLEAFLATWTDGEERDKQR